MDLFAKGYAFFRGGIACAYVLIQIHSLAALDVVCKIEVQNYSRGQVDYHELKVAMRALGFDVKKQEVLNLMREFDREGSGQIEYPDFLEIMTTKISERDPIEEISKAFKLFDEDNTGRISLRNLRRIAREMQENLSDDELQAMIDEFDKDGDGEISEAEFLAIMK